MYNTRKLHICQSKWRNIPEDLNLAMTRNRLIL
jgi:hypothetical protein